MFTTLIKPSKNELISKIPIDKILPNPYQPRTNFEQKSIDQLANSIKNYGLLQPIVVRKKGDFYFLVAGERRLRACKAIGLYEINAIVLDIKDEDSAVMALIENIQRENLDFFDEALGYKQLMEEFKLTQVEIANKVGKTQATIANKIRLLNLPPEVKIKIKENNLTERHARALLKLTCKEDQLYILDCIIKDNLNVNSAERLIDEFIESKKSKRLMKVAINDCRVIYNTIKKSLKIFQRTNVNYDIVENKTDEYYEIIVRINKKSPHTSSRTC